MSNNIFQFDRFTKLLARNIRLNPKTLLQSIIIYAGLPLLFLLINALNFGIEVDYSDRVTLLSLFVAVAFIFAPFTYFYGVSHPKKGLTDAMLPASVLEKFVVMQLVCIVFAPLLVLLLFGGMDSLLSLIFPKLFGGFIVKDFFASYDFDSFLMMFVVLQATFFCNLLFINRKILKTGGVFVLFWIVLAALFGVVIAILGSHTSFFDSVEQNFNFTDRAFYQIYADDHPVIIIIQLIRIFTQAIMPLALLVGSYFLMKKKRY